MDMLRLVVRVGKEGQGEEGICSPLLNGRGREVVLERLSEWWTRGGCEGLIRLRGSRGEACIYVSRVRCDRESVIDYTTRCSIQTHTPIENPFLVSIMAGGFARPHSMSHGV